MYKSYADKIEMLEIYNAGDEVEESRNMHFLDESRNPNILMMYWYI